MDSTFRSYSTISSQSARDSSQQMRPIVTSELIDYSSLISTLQLFLNMEPFFKKLCESSPSPNKFSGKIKKQLINFKSDNYTGISSIVPPNLSLQCQKPGVILNKILEDFKSCSEIPPEKRPDALFPYQNSQFTVKIRFSQLLSSHLSEILNTLLPKLPAGIIAIDIVYDQNPTCESVLNLLGNLTSYKNFEVTGLVTGHGFHYMSYLKMMEQWRSFGECKMYSWSNLVWNICTSASYPVLLVLSNNVLKNCPCFLLKSEMDSMAKFCKLQDSRIKIVYFDASAENDLETTVRVVTEKRPEEYLRRSQELFKVVPDKEEKKNREQAFMSAKESLYEYKRTVQELKKTEGTGYENILGRGRNYSTEPYTSRLTASKSYKEDLLYKPTRNTSTGLKENSSRPGILKSSGNDSRFTKNSTSSFSPLVSPRDLNSSRPLKESNNVKFDEEVTEKPSSILKNNWTGEKKTETVEKKVNFSDNVFKVEAAVKGQMPEIKISSAGNSGKLSVRTPDYKNSQIEPRLLVPYRSSEFIKNDSKDCWACPKCSGSIGNNAYECGNCKFINWDKFYSIKSKINKSRSESIPVKSGEKEDLIKNYRPGYFESRAGAWRSSGNEIKIQENYITEEFRKRTARELQSNR